MTDLVFPVKIKEIILAGGACPYQMEAITEDGRYFYMRYRGGRLRAGVSNTEDDFWQGGDKWNYNVIDVEFGNSLDGWADHSQIAPLMEGKVVLPPGVLYESFPRSENASFPRSKILP